MNLGQESNIPVKIFDIKHGQESDILVHGRVEYFYTNLGQQSKILVRTFEIQYGQESKILVQGRVDYFISTLVKN